MNILLIAGHGAGDPGAVSTIDGVKNREADEGRALVSVLARELKRYDCTVGVYNTAKNAFQDLSASKLPASVFKSYDYVLELHFNAGATKAANGKATGTECYVTTSERGTTVEQAICEALARLGFTNRGVKRKNFAVIAAAKNAGISSALLEICFIDDPDDMRLYRKLGHEAIARAIADGIATGYGLPTRKRTHREIVQDAAKLSDSTMDYLASYKYGSDLLRKLAEAINK